MHTTYFRNQFQVGQSSTLESILSGVKLWLCLSIVNPTHSSYKVLVLSFKISNHVLHIPKSR